MESLVGALNCAAGDVHESSPPLVRNAACFWVRLAFFFSTCTAPHLAMATLSRGTSQLVHSFPHFALEWPAADGDSESIPAAHSTADALLTAFLN